MIGTDYHVCKEHDVQGYQVRILSCDQNFVHSQRSLVMCFLIWHFTSFASLYSDVNDYLATGSER